MSETLISVINIQKITCASLEPGVPVCPASDHFSLDSAPCLHCAAHQSQINFSPCDVNCGSGPGGGEIWNKCDLYSGVRHNFQTVINDADNYDESDTRQLQKQGKPNKIKWTKNFLNSESNIFIVSWTNRNKHFETVEHIIHFKNVGHKKVTLSSHLHY